MKKYSLKLTVLLTTVLFVISSCTKSCNAKPVDGGSNPPTGSTGKTVKGVVLDTKGNPVAGASVRAENDVINAWVEGTTDANGKYTLSGIEWGV